MLDLFEILRQKIAAVPEGDHLVGLKAVQLHIETAIRHYTRGQTEQDATAFTDSVYRCNQAFEGSIKEAYRVLAGQDPENETPYKIEDYLAGNSVLRERVLSQFRNYRTDWRNPSTHNYKLDFDDDEALFAMTSVSVFAIALCDQIIDKLTYLAAQRELPRPKAVQANRKGLLDNVAQVIKEFSDDFAMEDSEENVTRWYSKLTSALSLYLSNAFPSASIQIDPAIAEGRLRPDIRLILRRADCHH